jgi:tyramine---L-glutamate ligase
VGGDLILGREPDGSEDCVIEVNPRLTTSFVGLRAAARSNLAEAMLQIAQGEEGNIQFADRAIEFDSSGNVSFMR